MTPSIQQYLRDRSVPGTGFVAIVDETAARGASKMVKRAVASLSKDPAD